MPKAPYINSQTIRKWVKANREFRFVDVREPKEYDDGHLPDAINIPYYEIKERREEIPLDRPVVIYCTFSSWRAPYAANWLADLGLDNVYVLEGGASGWNSGGQIIYATDTSKDAQIVPKPGDLKKEFDHPLLRAYKAAINLTKDQLSEFDGKNGRPAYVAVNGVIYDVTQSKLWRGGEHDPSHGQAYAGQDLTATLELSPHGDKYVVQFPVVGKLIPELVEVD
ncbi:MAG: hypothetical protein K8I00_00825 [Candidatus Omnitrophica bacterium]|nr:hypothetical protein [Candidatus Omnitrophota bacterium]